MPRLSALGAVALLELLARAAPAGVVAAELLVLARADRRRDGDGSPDRGGAHAAGECRVDHVGAGARLVLVAEVAVAAWRLLRRQPCCLTLVRRRELRVEEMQHDLAADDAPQLGEHSLALA